MRQVSEREKTLQKIVVSLSSQVDDLQNKLDEAYKLLNDAYDELGELLRYKYETEKGTK